MASQASEIQLNVVPVIDSTEATNAPSDHLPPSGDPQDVEAADTESEGRIEEEELMEENKTGTIYNAVFFLLCFVISFLLSFPFSSKTMEWVLSPCITYAALGTMCCLFKSKTRFLFALEICLMLSAIVRSGVYGLAVIFTMSGVVILGSLLVPSFITCCIRGCLETEKDKKTMSKVVILFFLVMFLGTIWYLGFILVDMDRTVLSLGVILFLYMIFLHISVGCDTETIDEYFCHFANVYLCAICVSYYLGDKAIGLKMGTIGCSALYIILFYVDFFM